MMDIEKLIESQEDRYRTITSHEKITLGSGLDHKRQMLGIHYTLANLYGVLIEQRGSNDEIEQLPDQEYDQVHSAIDAHWFHVSAAVSAFKDFAKELEDQADMLDIGSRTERVGFAIMNKIYPVLLDHVQTLNLSSKDELTAAYSEVKKCFKEC